MPPVADKVITNLSKNNFSTIGNDKREKAWNQETKVAENKFYTKKFVSKNN